MAKDFSPEERLLRLIRQKTSPKRPEYAEPGKEEPQKTVQEIQPKVEVSIPRVSSGRPIFLRIEALNILLAAVLAGLLIYLVPLLFRKPENPLSELEKKAAEAPSEAPVKGKEEKARPPFSYFSDAAGAKNIFQPIAREEASSQGAIETQEAKKLEDLKSQLNLLGVVWGEKPQAIIEDKKAQKTYFLAKGESFDSVEVKDILENKVILLYNDQQFELVL